MIETSKIYSMGTIIDIQIEANNAQFLIELVKKRLKEYEHRFSANDSTSELMAINLEAGKSAVQVSKDLYGLIKLGKYHSLATDSNLNIAIGPLVQLWRIGFEDANVPSESEIQKALKLINPAQIELDDYQQSVYLQTKGMLLDLGALAKGYIADLILAELGGYTFQSILLNLGGNIVVRGPQNHNKEKLWRIGIQNPEAKRGQYIKIIKISNQSVVTSGKYERQLKRKGQTYHHIFDQITGYPIQNNIASLTIISDLSVVGEIWTTRLFGKSPEEILEIIEQMPKIECVIIDGEGKLISSTGID